jgi:hypothetical protein
MNLLRMCLRVSGKLAQAERFQFLGFGTAYHCGKSDQTFHPPRKENGFCYRARLYNGNLSCRPGHCLRGYTCCRCYCHAVSPHFVLERWAKLIDVLSLQATVSTHRDEQVPRLVGDNFPSRPDKFPPTCEQTQFGQRQGAEKFVPRQSLGPPSDNLLFSFGQLLLPRGMNPFEPCPAMCARGAPRIVDVSIMGRS